MEDWDGFLAPYQQTVAELKMKLKGIRTQFKLEGKHSPIEFVTGRVKPIESIVDKALKKHISITRFAEEVTDIAGCRVMCQFVEDIVIVVEHLRKRNDFRILEERDYISNKKPSGYRSYHLVIEYPVQTINGEKKVIAEIQIRTLAMNFWATIEHSLSYKYRDEFPEDIKVRLQRASEAAFQLDEEMSHIRDEIHEAQTYIQKQQSQHKTTIHTKKR
ncbi:GTP pyrophosphokinase [Brochothrix thermosphacta]|uniref:GTP pyrophosphokinase n=1 Tax=Brochothrix thermosphacta TaxID=2756 RepID=UPI00083FB0D4|nr:GTP pyrophosphokinase family protein [Brochothrix thermosphacta]ODJ63800.1 GTP pyrophosphokinase [Brochothrix thermosphacta]